MELKLKSTQKQMLLTYNTGAILKVLTKMQRTLGQKIKAGCQRMLTRRNLLCLFGFRLIPRQTGLGRRGRRIVMRNRQEFGVENEIGQVTCNRKEVLNTCTEQKIPKVACQSIRKCSSTTDNKVCQALQIRSYNLYFVLKLPFLMKVHSKYYKPVFNFLKTFE